MKNFYIESTEYSPRINIDFQQQKFELTGVSRPENVIAFYESIILKLDRFIDETIERGAIDDINFSLKFDLRYMNSGSSKYIMIILDRFRKLLDKNAKIKIDWYYNDLDDQILEDGEILSEVIRVPFNLIQRN
ncbi:MAG: DUF1987 domain-containing protein [Bacteroidales bacterium]|nr:DUF1987 domain-containing protein [Bacteroidales bacterium]